MCNRFARRRPDLRRLGIFQRPDKVFNQLVVIEEIGLIAITFGELAAQQNHAGDSRRRQQGQWLDHRVG